MPVLFVALILLVVAVVLHLFSPWPDIARLVGGVAVVILLIWAILALTGRSDANSAAVVAGPLLLAPLPRYRRQFTIR